MASEKHVNISTMQISIIKICEDDLDEVKAHIGPILLDQIVDDTRDGTFHVHMCT